MPAETLTFSCVHCQTRLTVRASLAGVTGPCPSCRGTITAPSESAGNTGLASPAESLPTGEAAAPPASSEASPESSTPAPPQPPASGEDEDEDESELLPSGGPRIRPEPRNLPDRPQIIPIAPRHSTSDRRLRNKGALIHDATRRPFRLHHALLPAAYVAMAVGVVGTLLYFYAPGSPGQRMKDAAKPLVVQGPAKGTPPAPRPPFVPPARVSQAPDVDADRSTGPDSSAGRSESPAIAAYDMLESFLQAKDAASRLNQVEPAATEEELAATLLGGELPPFSEIASDPPRQQPDEEMTEFPYRVSFPAKDAPNKEFGILVRQRGSQPPRVFLPAFLDLVGGRLSNFTAKPNTLPPARFHVYLAPIAECYEKDIPGADRKFTLKLMTGPAGKETARAYAANASRLRKLVDDPNYPIRWGMLRRATVSVRWNHQEDPARPFLELVDINSPDWNP